MSPKRMYLSSYRRIVQGNLHDILPRPLGSVQQRSHERGDDFIRVDVIHNVKEVYRRLPEAKRKNAYDVKHDVDTYNQTRKVLGGNVAVVFYETTTCNRNREMQQKW